MPLVFSPLSEGIITTPPPELLPRRGFVMHQIGAPPQIDREIFAIVDGTLSSHGYTAIDADESTGSKDYLDRIHGLIRGTGFSVAIFSEGTRPSSFANIALELGYATMCGKPFMVAKSKDAAAPSNLNRTDWIEFDLSNTTAFVRKLNQALKGLTRIVKFERQLVDVALKAPRPDCGVAFEHASKAFLLSGQGDDIRRAQRILDRLESVIETNPVDDLERLRNEIRAFILQAEDAA